MKIIDHRAPDAGRATPDCSVCIANYNGESLLADCIGSVLAQTGDCSIEIIVHDDASTDASLAVLREKYPQVKILASASNVGFCVSNNRMVASAQGRYVLLLNNDAALHPDAVSSLLALESQQQAILTLPQFDWQSGEPVDRGCFLDIFYNPVPNLDARRREVAYGIGACLFMARDLWNELGGFPEWIGSIGEDMYICCLARLRGLPVMVTPGSGYRHRQGASFGGNRVDAGRLNTTFRRRALSERNKTAVMVICTPGLVVWPMLALHFLALALEGAVLALLKRDARVWREIYGPTLGYILRELGNLRSRRRLAQASRRTSLRAYFRAFVVMPRKFILLRRYGIPKLR